MPQVANHIIRSVLVDFQFTEKSDGFALQQEVRSWVDEFVAKLDKELNGFVDDETLLSIDKLHLEIDLKGTAWREEAGGKIISELKDKILLSRAGIIDLQGYAIKKTEQHFASQFLFFIENGHLPWQVSHMPAAVWKENISKLLRTTEPVFLEKLKELLQRSSIHRARFSENVSLKQAIGFFELQPAFIGGSNGVWLDDLQSLIEKNSAVKNEWNQAFLLKLFNAPNWEDLQTSLQETLIKHAKENKSFEVFISTHSFQSPSFTNLKSLVQKQESENLIDDKDSGKLVLAKKETTEHLLPVKNFDFASTEPIYITNAGLVIVAAFLPVFFERTKLVDNYKIVDDHTAVCMVNYLATGSIDMHEYELVLPKILCGIAPGELIETNLIITDHLKKEADDLLQSVIEYWSILKNTSVAGLRETFLQREGKLHFKNNEWWLQVEQKQFDMLLDQLPWNISMIKLAWMPGVLRTEW
ncbi:MAG: contractile injection system tape measure protein [Bacteroidota bacterium]